MARNIHHVGYKVKDLEKALEPYLTILGGEITSRGRMPDSGKKLAFVRAGGLLMEFVEYPEDPNLQNQEGPVYDHVAFEVDDLDGVVAQLQAHGIASDPQKPRPSISGGRTTFFFSEELAGRVQLLGE